jgi:CPA1 family monovalent cation:H+ antiporter
MTSFQTIALLITLSALGTYINARLFKLPSTVGLMLFALLLSVAAIGLHRMGLVNLGATSAFVSGIDFSAILLHGMLSFLLFAGALHINLSELHRYRFIVGALATGSVVIATFVTGSIVWYVAHGFGFYFPYIYALVFGALIAPTDPVAVLSILQQTGMPKSLRVKIGCESLFNDGVGVVVFMALLGIAVAPDTTALPGFGEIASLLIWQGVGSVVLGLTLGWIAFRFLLTVDDYKVEVLLTLALTAGGYSLAEAIHVSAPITMVVAGLVIGNHGRLFGMSHKTRHNLDMFWELLDEILNAVLFMLMGLELLVITITRQHMILGLVAIAAMLIGRYISVAIPVYLMHFRYQFERGTSLLLTWGGLRGGISIALALSLPAVPEKDLILDMTYVVVIFSILFQGTTFGRVANYIVNKRPA